MGLPYQSEKFLNGAIHGKLHSSTLILCVNVLILSEEVTTFLEKNSNGDADLWSGAGPSELRGMPGNRANASKSLFNNSIFVPMLSGEP